MFSVVPTAGAPSRSRRARPVPGYSGHWWNDTNSTRGRRRRCPGCRCRGGRRSRRPAHARPAPASAAAATATLLSEAEAHRPRRGGVVTGRAHGAERRRRLRHGRGPRSRSARRRRPARRRPTSRPSSDGVGVESPATGRADAFDGVEVPRRVHALELLAGGVARARSAAAPRRHRRTGHRAAPPRAAPGAPGARARSGGRGSGRASRTQWTPSRGYRPAW